jgi:hypothetical protein
MRKTARLKLEYLNLLESNMNLVEMINHCDSMYQAELNATIGLYNVVSIRDEQIINLTNQRNLEREKYQLADQRVAKHIIQKFIWMGATITAVVLLTFSLIFN